MTNADTTPTVVPVHAGLQDCAEVRPGGLLLPQQGQDPHGAGEAADHPGHDVQDDEEEHSGVDD